MHTSHARINNQHTTRRSCAVCTCIRNATLMTTMTALTMLVVAAGGCSSFNRDFNALAAQPAPSDDIAGVWTGSWISKASSHQGSLRCIVTPLDEQTPTTSQGRRYEARFRATYARIFTFSYTMELTTEQRGDAVHFEGEADLGFWGTYTTQGHATPLRWESVYQTTGDHGRFEMTRPDPNP